MFFHNITSENENFKVSYHSELALVAFFVFSLFILKKKGIKLAGNITYIVTLSIILFTMNILIADISPIFKYTHGFYTILAFFVSGVLFASRPVILIFAVLIFASTTNIFIFSTSEAPLNSEYFTSGYIYHSVTLLIITTIIYFTKKFTELTITKIKEETAVIEKQNIELSESESQYRSIIESTSEGCWVINSNEITIDVNNSLCTMLGYSREEMIGKSPIDFIESKNNDFLKFYMNKAFKEDHITFEIYLRSKSGKNIPVIFNATSIKNNKNEIQKAFAFITDITGRKKSDRILKEKEEKLIESNKTKDKFFSIIAHDLKSPFNSILGFTELLLENSYDKQQQQEFLKRIHISTQNTYELLENLLLWSSSQRGNIEYRPENENLYLLTLKTCKLLEQSALKKSITLTNKIPESIYVEADTNMLQTILRNLVHNSIKFTNTGGKVNISAKMIEGENNKKLVEVSVSDNGVGIRPKIKTGLFKITENTSTEGTENEGGTGLGLILCKEFVEKHGGEIWVESELGKGSKFKFTLTKRLN